MQSVDGKDESGHPLREVSGVTSPALEYTRSRGHVNTYMSFSPFDTLISFCLRLLVNQRHLHRWLKLPHLAVHLERFLISFIAFWLLVCSDCCWSLPLSWNGCLRACLFR